ncbi:rRNA pseudouridine synthase [Candidatus Uhrbacteria bacterium]|nr:rRNA pseudouridine synthase [Candidatus Uhrbacteria bacterium]
MRINKFLAERGICSRRTADALIDAGKVLVNGVVAQKGLGVTGEEDIRVNGKRVQSTRPAHQYLAFHKPVGIMTSVDPNGRDTVATFLHLRHRLFPIGRLDVASSGLLLLTNDGELSEAITHPRGDHEKEYDVVVDREITAEALKRMEDSLMILGSRTKKARTKRMALNRFQIVLTEGRNRQIRRMCEQLGYNVNSLKRIRVMNILLGDLPVGATRPLTTKELTLLKEKLGTQTPDDTRSASRATDLKFR